MKIIPEKVIPKQIVTESCYNCPYSRYDSYYSMGTDSGYDCHHDDVYGRRIADDGQIDQHRKKKTEAKRLPLFPETVEEPDPMSFPKWCPLEDYTKEDFRDELD